MVIQSSGAISFDEIQTEFGGIYPISLNEYYQDANQAYTSGVTGIPNIGSAFSISEFYGKAKSSSNFSIATIANLVLWHNGYNIDGSNNSTLSSGTAISSWYNSGTDTSLTTTQVTTTARPTYTQNGAEFSGTGKMLTCNINLNLSAYTTMNIFIVWKKTLSSNILKWLWSQDNGGYDRTLIINKDTQLYIGRGDGGAIFYNYAFPLNTISIVNCEYNNIGATGYFLINNSLITTFSCLKLGGTATTKFGSNGGNTSIDGVIHEILIISRILTTTERTNIYNALLEKYP